MEKASKIVLVENDMSWRKELARLLHQYHEKREIMMVNDVSDFNSRFSKPSDFDDISLCLLDLELGPQLDREISDRSGVEKVLPRIRSLAPWVPVACISVWLEDSRLAGRLSTSDLDGFYSKKKFFDRGATGAEFTEERWNEMLVEWNHKRAAWLMGLSTAAVSDAIHRATSIQMIWSNELECALSDYEERTITAGLCLMGIKGTELSISDVVGSYSGVLVTKIHAFGNDDGGPFESKWLVKWGHPIRKLAKEAEGHKRWFMRGMKRSLQVPQLTINVLPWNGVGFLAYYYEDGAETALELLKQHGNYEQVGSILSVLAKQLYQGAAAKPYMVQDILRNWCGLSAEEAAPLCASASKQPLMGSRALIHGDLHLRNIIVAEGNPTLIDFAKSDFGPVAVDAAKVLVDAAVFANNPKALGNPASLEDIKNSDLGFLWNAFKPYFKCDDDKQVIEILIRGYASKYRSFPDVAEDAKDELKRVVMKDGERSTN